jgi:hypothetical protein
MLAYYDMTYVVRCRRGEVSAVPQGCYHSNTAWEKFDIVWTMVGIWDRIPHQQAYPQTHTNVRTMYSP